MTILLEVAAEHQRATQKFGAFNSTHEGYAVLLEEVEELWDEIKADKHNTLRMRQEAIQVAAMAVRFVQDLCLDE